MTKLLPLFAASLLATTGAASASNTFGLNEVQDSDSIVELGNVVAAADGVVKVYEYRTGDQGRLLGSEPVRAGANTDVRVSLGVTAANNAVAVLKVDGQAVDQQVIRFNTGR